MTKRPSSERAIVYSALRDELLRLAMSLTGSRHDAEDLVQSAFERWTKLDSKVPIEAVKPLLYTIVKHLAFDRSRHRQRWRAGTLDIEPADDGGARDSQPHWVAISSEQLDAALAICQPRDRDVFRLHYVDGLRYREIAAALGLSMGTVATRLHRVRNQLRAELESKLPPHAKRKD